VNFPAVVFTPRGQSVPPGPMWLSRNAKRAVHAAAGWWWGACGSTPVTEMARNRLPLGPRRGMDFSSVRGYEIGAGGGFITAVDNRPERMPIEAQPAQLELSGKCLQGFATRFWKPHTYDGRIEAFAPGAFARTLAMKAAVRFLVKAAGGAGMLGVGFDLVGFPAATR
jgi:hypothetical protein